MRTRGELVAFLLLGLALIVPVAPGLAQAPTGGPARPAAFTTIEPGVLNVACTCAALPHIGPGAAVGVHGEFLALFLKEHELRLQVQKMPFASIIQTVQSKRADIGSSFIQTPERARVVAFAEPLFYDFIDLTQKRDGTVTTLKDLKGKQVGSVQGYTFIQYLRPFLGDDLHLYPDIDALFADLVAGRLAVTMSGAAIASYTGKLHPAWGMKTIPLKSGDGIIPESALRYTASMIVNKENPGLVTALNTLRDRLKANGQLKEILAKYGLTDPAFYPE